MLNMYDVDLLSSEMVRRGFTSYRRLALAAKVDPKTAKSVVEHGTGWPESVYKIAKVLGFKVKMYGSGDDARFDFSAIMKNGNGDGGRKGAA